jgi:hypothetical protein
MTFRHVAIAICSQIPCLRRCLLGRMNNGWHVVECKFPKAVSPHVDRASVRSAHIYPTLHFFDFARRPETFSPVCWWWPNYLHTNIIQFSASLHVSACTWACQVNDSPDDVSRHYASCKPWLLAAAQLWYWEMVVTPTCVMHTSL